MEAGHPFHSSQLTRVPRPCRVFYVRACPELVDLYSSLSPATARRQRGDDSRRESTRVTRFPLSRKRSCPSLVSIWLTRYLRRGHGEVGCSFTNARTSTPASKRHLREQFNAVNSGHRRRCRGTWGRVHGTSAAYYIRSISPAQARRGPGSEGLWERLVETKRRHGAELLSHLNEVPRPYVSRGLHKLARVQDGRGIWG
jgi:hypothetical protein